MFVAMTIRPSPIHREHDRPAPPLLLTEAGAAILAATLAIRLRPFRTIAEGLDDQAAQRQATDAETGYWIRRAVLAWGRRLPWRAKCFEQGLAAAWMLRRRGLAYAVHYGAANANSDLIAHVWVTSGSTPIVGCENRDAFSLLATFRG